MFRTSSNFGKLNGQTLLEFVTGETVNISKYMDFDFYDRFWFKQDAVVGETKLGRWIGVAYGYGSLMNYWVIPESGIPASRTKLQQIIEVKSGLEANKDKLKAFYMKVSYKLKNSKWSAYVSISPEEWKYLVDSYEAFAKEFENVFDNPDVSDADDFSPDNFDGYVNMYISMDRGVEEPHSLNLYIK